MFFSLINRTHIDMFYCVSSINPSPCIPIIRTQTLHAERVPNPNTKPTLVGRRVVLAALESCEAEETMGQIV